MCLRMAPATGWSNPVRYKPFRPLSLLLESRSSKSIAGMPTLPWLFTYLDGQRCSSVRDPATSTGRTDKAITKRDATAFYLMRVLPQLGPRATDGPQRKRGSPIDRQRGWRSAVVQYTTWGYTTAILTSFFARAH